MKVKHVETLKTFKRRIIKVLKKCYGWRYYVRTFEYEWPPVHTICVLRRILGIPLYIVAEFRPSVEEMFKYPKGSNIVVRVFDHKDHELIRRTRAAIAALREMGIGAPGIKDTIVVYRY